MDDICEAAAYGDLDSDTIENAFLHQIFAPREPAVSRSKKYGRLDLDELTEGECKSFFRFHSDDLKTLATALGLPPTIKYENRLHTTGVEGLCILLRRFAYPNRLCDLEQLFGLSSTYLSIVSNKVMQMILENYGSLLQGPKKLPWLNEDRFQLYADAIHDKGAPMTNCWGFIDGTARPICRPKRNQEEYYSGHKRVHCVKYLSVLCPDGIVCRLVGPYPGRRHDSGILRDSMFYGELEECFSSMSKKFCLYGDAGFPISDLLLCPYRAAQPTRAQKEFNYLMSSSRQAVEWGYGKVISEFAFLDFKKNQKLLLQDISAMYTCATLLANCHSCLYGSQTSQYFSVEPPTLAQYLSK